MASLFLGSLAEVRELIVEAEIKMFLGDVVVIPRASCAGGLGIGILTDYTVTVIRLLSHLDSCCQYY